MNKRIPLLLSLLGLILLAASIAYWILKFVQPPQRPLAAVVQAQMPDPPIDAAGTLFGGQVAVVSATNYQLTGVVAAGSNSWAIIVADNGAPKALRVGKELSPGVTLSEVNPRYVMLSDNGVKKRVDLAQDTKAAAPMGGNPGGANATAPGSGPIMPAGNPAVEPPLAAGAVNQQMQQQVQAVNPGDVGQHDAPPQNPNSAPQNNGNPNVNPNAAQGNGGQPPVQMAPPTRAIGVPSNGQPSTR